MNVVIKSLSELIKKKKKQELIRIVGDPNGTRRLVSVGSGWKLLSWLNLLCPLKKLAPRRRMSNKQSDPKNKVKINLLVIQLSMRG
jgi:hypothetical protein